MLWAIPCLAAAIFLYRWLRQKGAWRYEPIAFASVLVVGLAVYQPRATLTTLWIFLAAYGGGRFVRERAGLTTKSHAEEISLSTGVGLACLIFLLFLLGLLGLYDPWSLAAVLGICVLGFHREIRKLPASLLGLMRSWASNAGAQTAVDGSTRRIRRHLFGLLDDGDAGTQLDARYPHEPSARGPLLRRGAGAKTPPVFKVLLLPPGFRGPDDLGLRVWGPARPRKWCLRCFSA